MGMEDTQSDLCALKKLYGLIHSGGGSLQDTSSEILDEKARIFLKNLLDGAAERIFEAHSEIIAAYLGAFYAPFSTIQQFNNTLKQLSPVLSNVSENSSSVFRSTRKDLNSQQFISFKDEAEQSKLNISGSKSGTRNKRCQVCHRSIVNPVNSTVEVENSKENSQNPNRDINLEHQLSNLSLSFHSGKGVVKGRKEFNNKERRRETSEIQHNLRGNETLACSSDNFNADLEVEKKSKESDLISKEASSVIEQIESRISALEIAAKHLSPQRKKSEAQCRLYEQTRTESNTPITQTNHLGRKNLPSRVGSQLQIVPSWTSSQFAKKKKGIVSEDDMLSHSGNPTESLIQISSPSDRMPGEPIRNKINNKNLLLPAMVPSQVNKEHFDQNWMAEKKTMKVGTSQTGQTMSSVGSADIMVPSRKNLAVHAGQKLSQPTTRATTRRGKTLEAQPLMKRKALVDHKRSQLTASAALSESRSYSSLSWSTQQADPSGRDSNSNSNSNSNSEEYSLPGQISSHRYIRPTSGSQDEVYSLPHRMTRGRHGYSDSETTGRAQKVGSISSSESEGYQRSDRTSYWSAGSAATTGYTKNYRSTNAKKGRLRKLKDKLAIIFHHHHHHHHHPGGRDDRRLTMRPGQSLTKNTGQIFDQRSKEGLSGNMKKTVVANKKNQKGNLQFFAGRLLKNMRHAKKFRGGVGTGRPLEETKWWQTFSSNRGVKLANKSRVKLGVLDKSAKFKTLPKMT